MSLKLSVIIPAYNEEKTIGAVIGSVQKAALNGIKKEIIVVDDFSTDDTRKILLGLKGSNLKIFFHQKNQGKGTAIRTGLKHVTGDIILIQDADLEYNPSEYGKLLRPIIEDNKNVVYGTRLEYIKHNVKNMNRLHFIGNIFLPSSNFLALNVIGTSQILYPFFRILAVISGSKSNLFALSFILSITSFLKTL